MRMRIHERDRFDEALTPQSASAAETGNYVAMNGFSMLAVILLTGAVSESEDVQIELLQATDDSGTGEKPIEGATATIDGAVDEGSALVEINTESLDVDNGFHYVAARVTPSAATLVSATFIRSGSRITPRQAFDAEAVVPDLVGLP